MRPVVAADKTSVSAAQGTRASLHMRGSGGELRTCLAFDNCPLSTAQISGRQSISSVRKSSPVRIRAWAPSSFTSFPCIFCLTSSLRKCRKEMLCPPLLYPMFGMGIARPIGHRVITAPRVSFAFPTATWLRRVVTASAHNAPRIENAADATIAGRKPASKLAGVPRCP